MDWGSAYTRTRKASWEEIAQIIHDTVTMEEVIRAYRSDIQIRGNRCPCPLHNGKDMNFSFTQNGYKCFVCGASGDTIKFVQEMCGLSSRTDAMRQMNRDLCLRLPIDSTLSKADDAAIRARLEESRKKEAAEQAWWDKYHELLDLWIEYDRIRQTADWESDEYANAVKNIDRVAYELDCFLSSGGEQRLNT